MINRKKISGLLFILRQNLNAFILGQNVNACCISFLTKEDVLLSLLKEIIT